jgi:hypothetical protein
LQQQQHEDKPGREERIHAESQGVDERPGQPGPGAPEEVGGNATYRVDGCIGGVGAVVAEDGDRDGQAEYQE